jgi:hypothetical protein
MNSPVRRMMSKASFICYDFLSSPLGLADVT